jgi:FMN phosphatase YigB (HAD superfamily)
MKIKIVTIIFDFDHTLFSAKKFYFTLKKTFLKLGVKEKLFQETFEKSKGKAGIISLKNRFS